MAKPEWFQGVSWSDGERRVMWRADETELIVAPSINPSSIASIHLELSNTWWARLNESLDALAAHSTTRRATWAGTRQITQPRLAADINRTFPESDVRIDEWAVAHGDLTWANLTAPECWLLDWEDWGIAPRGWDAAILWGNSLHVPELADQVRRLRSIDLESRSGKLSQLWFCSTLIEAVRTIGKPNPMLEKAQVAAEVLLEDLRS